MSLENILSEILKEGEEEKLKIIRDAHEMADNILAKAKEDIKEFKREQGEKINKEAMSVKERIITSFELKKDKELLTEKKRVLDEVFDKVIKKVKSLPKEEYLNFLERLILKYVQTGDEQLFISEDDKKIVDEGFLKRINEKLRTSGKAGNIVLSEETASILGGVILGRENIKINASLELIVEDIREKWEKEVGQILFS
ncbi:MAG TPA: hypothetical protein EYP16_03440 [Candidatus Atribacteria bacterium]|nr:hypothetical protein [Candidatus Atribacteria bacterium]